MQAAEHTPATGTNAAPLGPTGGRPQNGRNDRGRGGNSRGRGRQGGARGGAGRGGMNNQAHSQASLDQAQASLRKAMQMRQNGQNGENGSTPSEAQPGQETTPAVQAAAEEEDPDMEVCFICAAPVVHNSVSPCNHRTCHICALRMRALYKNRACLHCRVS